MKTLSHNSARGFKHRVVFPRKKNRASALILALWALLLLSMAVFAWVQFIDQNISISGNANAALNAKALAHSGVYVALHPRVSQATPLLHRHFNNSGYDVQVV